MVRRGIRWSGFALGLKGTGEGGESTKALAKDAKHGAPVFVERDGEAGHRPPSRTVDELLDGGVYNRGVTARTLDWIWQNRQWLFSGAGISVLAALFWIAKRVRARRPPAHPAPGTLPQKLQLAPVAPPRRFTKPTPQEIKEQILSVPPFQQRSATRAYEGLKVCWLAEFSSVQEDPYELRRAEGPVRRGKKAEVPWLVTLFHRQENKYGGEIVSCYGISLSAYPQLKFAHAKTPVVVSGTIRSVSIGVDLIDVTLEFPAATDS
jgi:hypothetical protein